MKQSRIIIIEDDIENLDSLCCGLYDFYDLQPISDEQFTLDYIDKMQPDLIILDTEMQNVDIFSVYQSLQAHPSLKTIPVLFVTHMHNIVHQNSLEKLQIKNCILKPYNLSVLKDTIHRLLQ